MRNNEICDFMYNLFEIIEIRARVGNLKSITFEILTKEDGHNIPHVHAEYEKWRISISLLDYSVIAGNMPIKNQNIAIKWVKENITMLQEKWSGYHMFNFPVIGLSGLK